MTLKKSADIFLNVFDVVYKFFFYTLLTGLFTVLIIYLALIPTLKPFLEQVHQTGIMDSIKTVVRDIIRLDGNYVSVISEEVMPKVKQIGTIFDTNGSRFLVFYLLTAFVCAVYAFFKNIALFSMSDIVNTYMNSSMRDYFMSNYVRNFGRASLYALLKLAVDILTNGLFVLIGYFFSVWCVDAFGLFSLSVIMLFSIVAFSVKKVFLARWLPIMINENKNAFKSLIKSFSIGGKKFFDFLGRYWLLTIIGIVVFVTFFIATFGIAALFLSPALCLFGKIFELVLYYDSKKNKYYLNDNVVVGK